MIRRKIITNSIKSQTIGSTDIYNKPYFQPIFILREITSMSGSILCVYMLEDFPVNHQVIIIICSGKKTKNFFF
jgi:hypothetical protein